MSILTGRELEFLASLKTSWRLYWNELARLLKEQDNPCDRREAPSTALRPAGEKYRLSGRAFCATSPRMTIR